MAATMLDNARGAVTIFESAVEGLQISLWNLLSGSFVDLVKQATSIIDSFNAMDGATQMAALKLGAVGAALGPVLTVAGKLVGLLPKIVPALSAMMSPLGVVTAGLLLFGAASIDTNNSIGTLLESIGKKASQKLTKFNSTISKSIRQVSERVPALVTSITNVLNDVMPKLSVAASKIVVGLVDSIAENADSIIEIA